MKDKKTLFYIFFLFILANHILLAQDKQKIIFDCDLGDDIDDAFALALILSSPEFDVLGVVMDYGSTSKRAKIACRMLYEVGREDIPVIMGKETKKTNAPQYRWGEGFEKLKPVNQSAADFIIKNLRAYPHEIILFTVGPVPNMAEILNKDPEALTLAKKVYSMFGSFYMGYGNHPVPSAEWNVRADVSASKMFSASGANVVYAGLDITTFVKFEKEMREKLLMRQSPLTDALTALYTLWGHETPTLYDVVAIGMVLWPDLFSTRKAHVRVIDGGYTIIDESKDPNCEIGMSIQKDEFLKRILDRYLTQNLMRK